MQNRIFIKLFVYLFLFLVLLSYPISAEQIIGDVNGDGAVGLEEAIYALQVSSEMRPSTGIASDSGPRCSAWGTYTYSSGIITVNFTFSTFTRSGPSIGTFELNIEELSATTMTFRDPGNNSQTWTRETGTAGDIVGRWDRNDTENNSFVLILDSGGSVVYSAYGDYFTKAVDVARRTMTIDGKFTDWSGISALLLYDSGGNCGNTPGREIRSVYVTEDDNYIYLRMKLNGPPDPTFRYKFGEWFHIRVTPPPAEGIMLASSVCGKTFSNGLVAFGNTADNTADQFECRFDKCDVDDWRTNMLSAWSDQDSVTVCRHSSDLPILNFDFSMCEED